MAPTFIVDQEKSMEYNDSSFEGPEKLLELWFSAPMDSSKMGLRSIPRADLDEVLDLAHCKVLSVLSSNQVDAYLLSESSLFVFAHKLILKTCGTTTLLASLPRLLELAASVGFEKPIRVFYSRKNFMFPSRQLAPHKSWSDEVKCLETFFPSGSAYAVGPTNKAHWYLFSFCDEAYNNLDDNLDPEDETLEVLMTEMSPQKSLNFYSPTLGSVLAEKGYDSVEDARLHGSSVSTGHLLGAYAAEKAGVQELCWTKDGKALLDAFSFEPMGFSSNALCDDRYATIHVTPQEHCSYASFETNVSEQRFGRTMHDTVAKTIDVFGAGRFSVSLFQAKDPNRRKNTLVNKLGHFDSYIREECIVYDFPGYDLLFCSFRHK